MTRTPDEKDAWEFHRWQGFTRFRVASDGWLVARIAPSCDILEKLAEYFAPRLRGRKWTLLDDLRAKSVVCKDNGEWQIEFLENKSQEVSRPDEIEGLWQTYFDSIEIRERHNPRLQKQHIPARYRPYLPELNNFD